MEKEKKYYTTIGLEIHAELKTQTKMFCNSKNDADETRPNVNICPVCMGHPGTLPFINKEAVKHVLKVGTAVGGKIADFTEFDRKNYFYPDIPKGYQISQYKYPLVSGGSIAGVELTRVHLEEDTATSKHDQGDYSLVDFNRAGVPLMELVTEPVITSAKQAVLFAKELQLLLRHLGAGDANMEKGEMRVEANISISDDPNKFGTKVEVKNLNSFKSVERAVEYELKRHADMLERGEKLVQETRGFDETTGKTFSQRVKEDSHDYRYFPDPDLPKLYISEIPEFSPENLKKEMPELPWIRRDRYKALGLKDETAELFVQDLEFGNFFDAIHTGALVENSDEKFISTFIPLASNYISSDLVSLKKLENSVLPNAVNFSKLIRMILSGDLSSRGAKDTLAIMCSSTSEDSSPNGDPEIIAKSKNLIQNSNEAELKPILEKIVADNPAVVEEYKGGKTSVFQFLIGQAMKDTKGSANPEALKKILLSILS